eukprot:PhM_4_TR5936/c0_g1_i1/m.80629
MGCKQGSPYRKQLKSELENANNRHKNPSSLNNSTNNNMEESEGAQPFRYKPSATSTEEVLVGFYQQNSFDNITSARFRQSNNNTTQSTAATTTIATAPTLDADLVELNVGGKLFTTSVKTLCQVRSSALCKLVEAHKRSTTSSSCSPELFLDLNAEVFAKLLDYLRARLVLGPREALLPPFDNENEAVVFETMTRTLGLETFVKMSHHHHHHHQVKSPSPQRMTEDKVSLSSQRDRSSSLLRNNSNNKRMNMAVAADSPISMALSSFSSSISAAPNTTTDRFSTSHKSSNIILSADGTEAKVGGYSNHEEEDAHGFVLGEALVSESTTTWKLHIAKMSSDRHWMMVGVSCKPIAMDSSMSYCSRGTYGWCGGISPWQFIDGFNYRSDVSFEEGDVVLLTLRCAGGELVLEVPRTGDAHRLRVPVGGESFRLHLNMYSVGDSIRII